MLLSDNLTSISTYGWFGSNDDIGVFLYGWIDVEDLTGVTGGFVVAFAGSGYIQVNTFGAAGP